MHHHPAGNPASETRAASDAGTTRHPYLHAEPGATVDTDLCASCGWPDGGDRHTSPARVPEALAALQDARRAAVAAIGARRGSGLDDSVIADLDGRIARAMDLLHGLNPRPYLIAGTLPATAQERQHALPVSA